MIPILTIAVLALACAARAADAPAVADPSFTRVDEHGIEAARGADRVTVSALRPDVLRVRAGRVDAWPRDESWAALPASRAARAAMRPCGPNCAETDAARVTIDAAGALAIADGNGRPILSDARLTLAPDGNGFRLDQAMPADAHYFGLGDKAGPLDRRGRAFTLWNTDAYRWQEATDPLYKSIPFVLSVNAGAASGLFLDNTWRTAWDFGLTRPDTLSVIADGGALDTYVFTGPDAKSVLSAYAWLTGAPPLPPLWAFGFQQSRYSYETEAQVRDIANHLRADRIPTDVLWLDIGALDRKRAFTINDAAFPDFPGLVADLRRQGLRTVVITDLHLAADPAYPPFAAGEAGDHFLHRADGSRYVGEVWPGPCVFPEFSRAATRAWWGGLFRDFVGQDVAGFWNDMNEPAIFQVASKTMPPDVRHRIEEPGFAPRLATHAEMHNVYGMLNSRATYEGALALAPDRRPFVMTRASYAGGQRYAVTWTGDNSSTWNHLRLSTPQLLGLGLSGFAFAGDDLGGFASSPPADLLTRWLQLGAFNPIMRDHTDLGTAPQEPWVGGAEHEAIRRRFIETRYRLMPYLYATAAEAARDGIPMMRPMFLEFPRVVGDRLLDLEAPSQFMLGRALLVAPQPWPDTVDNYTVILPPGEWFDFWTGLKLDSPALARIELTTIGPADQPPDSAADWPHKVYVKPALDHLPVYVRAGSIIPSQTLVQSTAENPGDTLFLDVYPGPDCRGELYADDGETLGHARGAYFRQAVTCETSSDGLMLRFAAPEGTRPPWWSFVSVTVHDAPPRLSAGDAAITHDAASRRATFRIEAPTRETILRLHG